MQASYSLHEQARQQGYRVEAHETVTSTNLLALLRAKQGEKGYLWIVAEEQTQGVGRRGRVWHSPSGNLYSSLLLINDYTPERAALLGFVAGVAMADALSGLIGSRAEIGLKWPNDVLLDGAKLTGILVERHPLPPGPSGNTAIIVGIGINIVQAPSQANYAVTSLHDRGFAFTPQQIFMALSKAWSVHFDVWNQGSGFAHIREKWLHFAAGLGEKIYIQMQGQRVSGLFKTIDEAGQLVIETQEKKHLTISAGDVHFGDAATWRLKV